MTPGETSGETMPFRYTFRFPTGAVKEFVVELDHDTLELVAEPPASYPDWTRLDYHQCPNCPLRPETTPRCPIAASLAGVVEAFRESVSFEEVIVTVETQGRIYSKKTSLQQAISSLVGIFTVTSGCPVLNKLRPMVATHLPFMSPSEAVYRMMSMYLLAQFFLEKKGREGDWTLSGFIRFLDEARTTNTAFCRRLQSIGVKDASLNAFNMLNAMGEIARISLEADDLTRWERIFLSHYS